MQFLAQERFKALLALACHVADFVKTDGFAEQGVVNNVYQDL